MEKQIKEVEIYTDGACTGNPGPGGYAAVLLYKGRQKEVCAGYKHTTNNRMELLACIMGLRTLTEPCRVNLYSDSRYVVDGITKGWAVRWRQNGWMRNKTDRALNDDMWGALLDLTGKHDVSFIWVKGHNDNEYNELCDKLARGAIQSGPLLENDGGDL